MKSLDIEPGAAIARLPKAPSAGRPAKGKEPETVAVLLPKNAVIFLGELCDALGVPGGAAGFLTHFLTGAIREAHSDHCCGIFQEITQIFRPADDTDTDNLSEVAARWTPDDRTVVRRKAGTKAAFSIPSGPATPCRRPMVLEMPEKIRPALQRMMAAAGYYGTEYTLMGDTVVDWEGSLDRFAEMLVSLTDSDTVQASHIYGIVAIEKLRLNDDPRKQSIREWLFPQGGREAAKA
jgi:hypothetical protein